MLLNALRGVSNKLKRRLEYLENLKYNTELNYSDIKEVELFKNHEEEIMKNMKAAKELEELKKIRESKTDKEALEVNKYRSEIIQRGGEDVLWHLLGSVFFYLNKKGYARTSSIAAEGTEDEDNCSRISYDIIKEAMWDSREFDVFRGDKISGMHYSTKNIPKNTFYKLILNELLNKKCLELNGDNTFKVLYVPCMNIMAKNTSIRIIKINQY
jgi:hypothetical protein